MREPSPMTGDMNTGVTLSRTLIPTLPTGYLSRKRLFPLMANEPSGTTFVIAPGGYGKSSLVAEWVQYQSSDVIWMTVANGDSINEMSAMLIAATRRVIPTFAPWFEKEHPLRPTEVVRRWGNELMQTGREFIFVLDNIRNDNATDVNIAVKLIEQFPANIHFVAIRREEIQEIYSTCASRGPIRVINQNDLRFTHDEIEMYAANAGLLLNDDNRKILFAANGWPSATSLLRAHLQSGAEFVDLKSVMGSQSEPLRSLAKVVMANLDPDLVNTCEKLSVLESFNTEQAQLILEKDYSPDLIQAIARKGEIFTYSPSPQGGFIFSPMVRQILLENLQKRIDVKVAIHNKLITYFEKQGLPDQAIDHAFEAQDQKKISELFPNAARAKQARGQGGDLLRWSYFAGDSTNDGELKKSTVRATGFLADLDFRSLLLEVNRIRLLAKSASSPEFYQQFADGAEAYALATVGKFSELEDAYISAKIGTSDCLLGVDDQINLMRLVATKRYMWNEADGVEEIFFKAEELAQSTSLYTSHTFLLAIKAMYLHQRGEYRQAHEIAHIALTQHEKYGFVGNHGPLDVQFIIARCYLEFSRPQDALAMLDRIRNYSQQWKQWHWHLICDKHIIELLSYNGNAKEGLERIKVARDFIAALDIDHRLNDFVDVAEMAIRRRLQDFDRLEKLVKRAPNIRDTQQYKMAVDEHFGRKVLIEEAKKLPEKTPRDLIWKHLMDVSLNVDSEMIALPAMRKAMQVGAEVGARETFLRQSDEMGNYILKIANDFPTVYNEELATAMAARIKERGTDMTTAQQALTKRELEILRQLSTGRTLTVIAGELHISQNTMKTHLKNLYNKLSADGRNDAVEKAKALFLL